MTKDLEYYKRQEELRIAAEKEREVSDGKYSIKLVEKIFFAGLAAAGLGSITFLGKLLVDFIKMKP